MKKLFIILGIIILILFLGGLYTNLVNPYSPNTLVKPFFTTSVNENGDILIKKANNLNYIHTPFDWDFHLMTTAFRVFGDARFSEKPFCCTEQQIIEKIHNERFDVSKPYVTSGGHFSELYPRNFGIFYNSVLDGRTALSDADWVKRQRTTLQTIATDLELMKKAGKTYPQFELISPNTFIGNRIYTDQSDSIFGVLWTLEALTKDDFLSSIFPASVSAKPLQTKAAGQQLLSEYREPLQDIINNYLQSVITPKTGLIKTDITLSSARDGIRRQSSFYDNVIAWSTAKLAIDLGLQIQCPAVIASAAKQSSLKEIATGSLSLRNDTNCDFAAWKQKIITAFWDDQTGIFLDDLSQDSKENHIFSGDEFIVTSTQFLDLKNPKEKEMLERMIAYVKKEKLDDPFPLQYAKKDQPDRFYWAVRTFMTTDKTSYMARSIWSHWGMEYIKTLILLSDDHPEYLADAKKQLGSYKNNIEKYGGYPELYDTQGNIFTTPFYKSLLHTGWVVNYEEAKMMLQNRLQSNK